MKKFTFILFLFFNIVIAQKNPIKLFSISIDANLPVAVGDNFLNKGYTESVGFDLELQTNVGRNFLMGINYQQLFFTKVDLNLIGNFNKANGTSFNGFIGYRHFILKEKIYFEHRIGIGNKNIYNHSQISDYKVNGNNLLIGTKVNYRFDNNVNFYLGVDFNKSKYNVNLDGSYKDFYSNSYQIIPTLGMKFLFGKSI